MPTSTTRIRAGVLLAVATTALVACSGANRASLKAGETAAHEHAVAEAGASPAAPDASVERDVARLRAATEAFKSLDAAVAVGYPRTVERCIARPGQGGMGYHHENKALIDGKIEIEHPEVLVYWRTPEGRYELNGVEYLVPYSAHPPDAAPPTVMGQPMKRFDQPQLWYLHVWAWEDNPNGLFADWNPKVTC